MELQLGQRIASEGGSHRRQLSQRSGVSCLAQGVMAKQEIFAKECTATGFGHPEGMTGRMENMLAWQAVRENTQLQSEK